MSEKTAPAAEATTRRSSSRSDTRLRMLEVAEQLFAEHGIEGVSLREVGQQAGQRNNSAAQYHFQSREGLVEAIIERRSAPIEERRAELVQQLGPLDSVELRELLRCFVLPLAEVVEAGTRTRPTWYLRFLAQVVQTRGGGAATQTSGRPRHLAKLESAMRDRVPDLDLATYVRRQHWIAQTTVRILADQERERSSGRRPPPSDEIVADLLVMLVALLEAP